MKLRAVARGRLRQVCGVGGKPVDVELYGCLIARPPWTKANKTYVELDLAAAAGDLDALKEIDDFIDRAAHPQYKPFDKIEARLVVKIPAASVRYEDEVGDRVPGDAVLLTNAVVDVVVRPGAFGDFGYCWLLQRVKPHATRQP